MTKDEALKLALEALEEAHYKIEHKQDAVKREQAITAIKEALMSHSDGAQPKQELDGYVQKVIDALYENSDPVSVEAAELLEHMAQSGLKPVAWINWCAATGKRSVSFECESELASQPLYTKEQS